MKEILLVESNPVLLTARLRTLEAEGYRASGATAHDVVKAMKWGSYDLLIVDAEVSQAFDAVSSTTTPVLLMVTEETLDLVARALPMGLWAFLVRPFTAGEFKHTVSGAMERVEAVKAATQQKIAPLLHHVGQPLSSESELDRFFKEVLEMAAAETEADMVSIVVPDGISGELLVKARVGLGPSNADKKIAQWVMKSSKPLVVNNGRIDLEPDVRETMVGMGASSLVSIPLIARKKVVGIINSTKVERGRFTQGSLNFLSVLARHAAMLIQTGNLLRDSEEKRAKLERMLMKAFMFREEGQKK
jgi:CheY-like chemotaxis protein